MALRRHIALPRAKIRGAKRLIMVLDDERSVVATLCMVFEAYGYSTIPAHSGNEALSRLAGNCPDLLVAEISMQGMSGFDIALKLKAVCPDCRLLFMSWHRGISAASDGNLKRAGYDFEVLPKPIHPATMLAKIKAVLDLPAQPRVDSCKPRFRST